MKIMKYFVLSISLLATSANSGIINLVENGSFEDNFDLNNPANIALSNNVGGPATLADIDGIAGGEEWGVFSSLPGWNIVNAAGIEVQYNGVGGRDASDGSRFLEMDTHPSLTPANPGSSNGGISQNITGLIIGQLYNFSFDFMGRGANPNSTPPEVLDSNNLLVSWFGNSSELVIPWATEWSTWNTQFIASESSMLIKFEGSGTADGKGALLDNISLTTVDVPEPSMLALMLLGLGGLLIRKKVKV
jgi:hypothetical protein